MTFYKRNYYSVAKTTKGLDGNYYDSLFEASYANELFAKKKNKEIESYDTQVTFPIIVNGYKICDYIADFVVYHNNGGDEIVETKGLLLPVFRIKWSLMEALYGEEYTLTLVMQGKGKIRHPKKVIEF